MFLKSHRELIELITTTSDGFGGEVFLIGGTIRDLLLGDVPYDRDFDFVVEGDAINFARILNEKISGKLAEFEPFRTAKISELKEYGSIQELDFATARTEIYTKPGALPTVTPSDIRADLARRDFSINAMAISTRKLLEWLREETPTPESFGARLLDQFHGREDLAKRIIKVLHENSFVDDPTRIVRACRYIGRLSGRFEPHTRELALAAIKIGAFNTISQTRKLNEVRKICGERDPGAAFKVLHEIGALAQIDPFPSELLADFWKAVSSLRFLCGADLQELRFQVLLRLCFVRAPTAEREATFRGIGIGRKGLNLMTREVAIESAESLELLSDEAVAFRFCASGAEIVSSPIVNELTRRKLFCA